MPPDAAASRRIARSADAVVPEDVARAVRRQLNRRFAFIAWRRATSATEAPGRSASALTSQGVHITQNGRPMGAAGLQFARVVLATFIGAEPSTPRLRRELLGLRD